jgi:hypothetical protein
MVYDEVSKGIRIKADDTFLRGDDIASNYYCGREAPNSNLFLKYGIVSIPNYQNEVLMTLSIQGSDPLAEKKKR